MKDIQNLSLEWRDLLEKKEVAVLATLVNLQGSSYRSPGAKMIIFKNYVVGALGGGCFKEDLLHQAEEVFQTGKSKVVFYDTTKEGEIIWGFGSGCKGVLEILLEKIPFSKEKINPIFFGEKCFRNLKDGWMVTVFYSFNKDFCSIGDRLTLDETGFLEKDFQNADLEELILKDLELLKKKKWFVKKYSFGKKKYKVFFEKFQPRSLVLLGISPETEFLIQIARTLGWKIHLLDHRSTLAKNKYFPLANSVICAPWNQVNSYLNFPERTAFVIATHNYLTDCQLLQKILERPFVYIGLIGSKSRTKSILEDLKKEIPLLLEKNQSNIYSPAGLDIGSESPAEIALSLVSEIQAIFSKKNGGFLKNAK